MNNFKFPYYINFTTLVIFFFVDFFDNDKSRCQNNHDKKKLK